MFNKVDVIVAGAGISGLTVARKLADAGRKVLIIEKANHIGGHCYDYVDDHGILVHPHGPHIFHTNKKNVWDFLSRYTEWFPYHHQVRGFIDGQLIPIPFNLNTLQKLLPAGMAGRIEEKLLQNYLLGSRVPILELKASEDEDLQFLAEFVYEKVFLNYTIKQWGGKKPEDLDSAVSARVPVLVSRDNGYFQNAFQGIPLKGYSVLMNEMVNHPNIHLMLNTPAEELVHLMGNKFMVAGEEFCGNYIHTGPIDELFGHRLGELPYRSVRVEIESFPYEGFYQDQAVLNYPNSYDYTRITEFKHFQRNRVNDYTTICREYPGEYVRGKNLPVYVLNNPDTKELYLKYCELAGQVNNLYCLGRLGEYRYYDMDQAVESALTLASRL